MNIYGTELEHDAETPVLSIDLQRVNSGTSLAEVEADWHVIANGYSTTALICYNTRTETSMHALPAYRRDPWMQLHEVCVDAAMGLTVK